MFHSLLKFATVSTIPRSLTNRTITMRMNEGQPSEVKVSLMQNMKVKVNGKRVSLPYIKLSSGISIMKDGYRVFLRTKEGRTWKDSSPVILSKLNLFLVVNNVNILSVHPACFVSVDSIFLLNCVFAHCDDDLQFSPLTFYVTQSQAPRRPHPSFSLFGNGWRPTWVFFA